MHGGQHQTSKHNSTKYDSNTRNIITVEYACGLHVVQNAADRRDLDQSHKTTQKVTSRFEPDVATISISNSANFT